MEQPKQKKVVKKVVKQQPKQKDNSKIKDIALIALSIMVFIIFIRGFNIKSTIKKQNEENKAALTELVDSRIKQQAEFINTKNELLKNEILAAYALYSRLNAAELKEQEDYHKEQMDKWEQIMSNQVTKNDLYQLQDQLNDTVK